jgi:hypothetical protein
LIAAHNETFVGIVEEAGGGRRAGSGVRKVLGGVGRGEEGEWGEKEEEEMEMEKEAREIHFP